MRYKSTYAPIAVIALMIIGFIVGSAQPSWEKDADKRKADYMFMEAMRYKALDSMGPYFHLYRYAYELDTTDISLGDDLGYYYMALSDGESGLLSKGYNMMRNYFNSNPADYYSSITYGKLNEKMGNLSESLRVWETLDSLYPEKLDVAASLAEALTMTGDSTNLRRSIDVLNRLERKTGKDLGISSQRIQSLMMLNDTTSILAETDSIIKNLPKSSDARVYVGNVYLALDDNNRAMEYYNEACELDPDNARAFYTRALFFKENGDSVAYDREVTNVLCMPELDIEIKREILRNYVAELYQDESQHKRINTLFNIMLEEHPHDVDLRDLYVGFLWLRKDYDAAAEQMEYIVGLNPADAENWRSYASIYFNKEDYNKAIEITDRGLAYHPGDQKLIELKGAALQLLKKPQDVIELFSKAYEATDSTNIDAKISYARSLGDAYQLVHDYDKTVDWYEKALEYDPSDILTKNNYAYFLSCQDMDLDKAEILSCETVNAQPQNTVYLDTYAWVLFKKKNYKEAKEYIDKALEYAKEGELSAEYFEHAGDIYFMNGMPDEALEFWKQGLELEPTNELLKKKVKYKTYFFK